MATDTHASFLRTLHRYRGALLGGTASAASVALTLDPAAGIATSSMRFVLWFAVLATMFAVVLTTGLGFAEYRASRPTLPRAQVRRSRRRPSYN